ncbi:hypothetical protein SAY86_024073 [Trapa natans]|uniref:Exostosin GT47 domain-containing protein n=1 Tax=Trapa natans TaxID=22666 RepID=A0AAN7RC41_TRANT|nr:hypothetical protein SAY86_024073 [Trapa natans]
MDHKYRSILKVETRKLLWLLAISVAAILLVQYIELPHGNVLSLVFSANKASFAGDDVVKNLGGPSPSVAGALDNVILTEDLGPSNVPSIQENLDDNISFKGNGSKSMLSNETLSKGTVGSNISLEVDDYSAEDYVSKNEIITVDKFNQSVGGYAIEEDVLDEHDVDLIPSQINATDDGDSSLGKVDVAVPMDHSGSSLNSSSSPASTTLPSVLSHNITLKTANNNITSHLESVLLNTPPLGKELTPDVMKDQNSSAAQGKERPQTPAPAVITISEMNQLLEQSLSAYRSMKPRWSSKVDQELMSAKLKILNSPVVTNDPALYAPLYRNISMFKRSYEIMEEMLKVYIYKEGEKPILHQPVLKGIYASEGWFMKQVKASKKFVTKDARKAHLFYLPFSSRMLEETLYVPNSHSHRNLVRFLQGYLDLIGAKYPFWNRTAGADHFLVACHDWAPGETKRIMARCIRSLCNSDVKEGFVFGKDASLPETFVHNPRKPLQELGGKSPSKRSILAFFAGNMHGYLRPLLLQHWGNNRDPDMRIFGHLPKSKGTMNYVQHMKSSKYCICAKGYEVNSPRVVEAIFYECVPVIISDNFVPPFFEVLNWESFAVFVLEKDIPNLKSILLSIPEKRYWEMQMGVRKVQQHFLWHSRPARYDIFHMILHSVWYNRVLHVNPR